MAELGVNIDHVATIRQARQTNEPDPVWAAAMAELGGADGITIHLREDRRHIQDRDLRLLRETVAVKLNLEIACAEDVVQIACDVKPHQATLVPERREEVTTEGGLDVVGPRKRVTGVVKRLRDSGIIASLFIDPDPEQIEASAEVGASAVELHTGAYALAQPGKAADEQLEVLQAAARKRLGRRSCAACRSRADLPQRPPGGIDRWHVRAEYRAQHRLAGRICGNAPGGTGDEATDRVRRFPGRLAKREAACTAAPIARVRGDS